MSDIKINGRIKIKSFQTDFIKHYPYLVPTLINKEKTRLDNDYTIAKANTVVNGEYSPIKVNELSINGNLHVGTLEDRFQSNFGIPCEVIFRKGGKHYVTKGKYDNMSISEANAALQKEGAEKIVLGDITSYA